MPNSNDHGGDHVNLNAFNKELFDYSSGYTKEKHARQRGNRVWHNLWFNQCDPLACIRDHNRGEEYFFFLGWSFAAQKGIKKSVCWAKSYSLKWRKGKEEKTTGRILQRQPFSVWNCSFFDLSSRNEDTKQRNEATLCETLDEDNVNQML